MLSGLLSDLPILFDKFIEVVASMAPGLGEIDKENIEPGIRVRFTNELTGGFFMLRKSVHDSVLSLMVDCVTKEQAVTRVLKPLLDNLQSVEGFAETVDLGNLKKASL